ncbi:MAG: proteasome accessory factor PafA2 family protein, partial [Limisphaerales bacterium]
WIDPWLRAQDLEFHHIDPSRSLGLALAKTPEPWEVTLAEIQEATRKPPTNTRAQIRSHIMQQLKNQPLRYFVDWEIIDAEGINSLNLLNPFESSPDAVELWCRQLENLKTK